MNHQIILETLKKTLKRKKVSYKDLASEINMSESGLKKLLNSKDISINRLTQITNSLGVSLSDLINLAHEEEIEHVKLTKSQEEALLQDNSMFKVLWRMTVENKSEEETLNAEKINYKTLKSCLLKLENLDLIKITKTGNAIPTYSGIYRWSSEGKLIEKLNRDWSKLVLDKTLKSIDKSLHQLSVLQLSKSSKEQLFQKLQELCDEYARVSRKDKMKLANNDLESISLLIASTQASPLD